MTANEKKQLMAAACKVRMGVIKGTHAAKAGHPGGSLSAADLFTYLYCKELNVDPKDPNWADRDRFVLSKGHTAPGLYAALALRGFFPEEDLLTLRHIGSYLQGHPNMNTVPGVDMSTGSLGQGVSAACGMALAARQQGKSSRVYTLLGDGEIQEGQVWEAMMFAHHYKLDGHDFEQIEAAFTKARETKGVPFAIVMKTTKGKGVSFMENQAGWHGKAPNDEEYEIAMKELSAQLAEVEAM